MLIMKYKDPNGQWAADAIGRWGVDTSGRVRCALLSELNGFLMASDWIRFVVQKLAQRDYRVTVLSPFLAVICPMDNI